MRRASSPFFPTVRDQAEREKTKGDQAIPLGSYDGRLDSQKILAPSEVDPLIEFFIAKGGIFPLRFRQCQSLIRGNGHSRQPLPFLFAQAAFIQHLFPRSSKEMLLVDDQGADQVIDNRPTLGTQVGIKRKVRSPRKRVQFYRSALRWQRISGRQHAEAIKLETLRASCRFLDQQPQFLTFLRHHEADESLSDIRVWCTL